MPMQRDLYPANWPEIALAHKEAANWTCQRCGFQRGQLQLNRHGKLAPVQITVAHLDHDPWNFQARLAVLCRRCHILYDASQARFKRCQMQRARGQLLLPGIEPWYLPWPAERDNSARQQNRRLRVIQALGRFWRRRERRRT